jgi:uncharacterized protein (DUF58 family)
VNVIASWRRKPTSRPAATDGTHAPLLTPAEISVLAVQAGHLAQASARREVHDHHAGDWPSAWLGRGLDFEEARPYAQGDDIRDMDWRTTARLGHPFVKTYREERQPMLHLVLDRGVSMRFGTRRRLKVAQAARIAAVAAFAAAARNTAVGASLWQPDGNDRALPPRHDRASLLALLQAVATPCPPAAIKPQDAASERLRDADRLARLAADLPRGTRMLLLSDFAWLHADHAPLLARLGERLQVLAVDIVDAAERELPDVGLARFQDLSDASLHWLDTGSAQVRSAFAAAAAARRAAISARLARAGVACLEVGAELEDLMPILAGHA